MTPLDFPSFLLGLVSGFAALWLVARVYARTTGMTVPTVFGSPVRENPFIARSEEEEAALDREFRAELEKKRAFGTVVDGLGR